MARTDDDGSAWWFRLWELKPPRQGRGKKWGVLKGNERGGPTLFGSDSAWEAPLCGAENSSHWTWLIVCLRARFSCFETPLQDRPSGSP
jgi:hypothetical protein